MSRRVAPFESGPALSLLLFTIVLLLACFPAVTGQQSPATQERPRRAMPADDQPQEIIKIDTDLVPVNVTVTDAKGHLIRDLQKEDFKLFEDGVARPIASFNVETIAGSPRPVAIVFAIDISGSMTREEVERVSE